MWFKVFYTSHRPNKEHNQTLWTNFNERNETHFFIKIYLSHSILERRTPFAVSLRDRWRSIYTREDFFLPHIFSGSQGVPTLASPCKLVRNDLIDCVSLARLPIFCTLSKSDRVVITWSPSAYTPVRPECPDALSSSCLLIKIWQLAKAHGVTRNEPKIHVIC